MRMTRRLLLRASVAAGLLAASGRMAVLAQAQARATGRLIPIVSKKFVYEPVELTLKLNEPVVFQLTSLDVVMGFSVPDFGVRATIIPGQITELRMTPTKIGEFTFLCDVFCGSGHENMEGTMKVVA
ncbi:MAG: cytochrome c oxidase subunit II [Aromatoleum sp.]|nr:cytochrome c oxidase subunit II [Aromatoleum sp.]